MRIPCTLPLDPTSSFRPPKIRLHCRLIAISLESCKTRKSLSVVDTYLNRINCSLSSLSGRQEILKFPSCWSIESKNANPRYISSELHYKSTYSHQSMNVYRATKFVPLRNDRLAQEKGNIDTRHCSLCTTHLMNGNRSLLPSNSLPECRKYCLFRILERDRQ